MALTVVCCDGNVTFEDKEAESSQVFLGLMDKAKKDKQKSIEWKCSDVKCDVVKLVKRFVGSELQAEELENTDAETVAQALMFCETTQMLKIHSVISDYVKSLVGQIDKDTLMTSIQPKTQNE